MLKWTELAIKPEEKHFKCLSQELKSCGLVNEFSPTLLPDEFKDFESVKADEELQKKFNLFISELKNKFGQILIGGELRGQLAMIDHQYPAQLNSFMMVDALYQKQGQWWPRSIYFEMMQFFLAQEMKLLDIGSAALVIGTYPEARPIVSALIQIGYRNINLTCESEEEGEKLMKFFARNFFDVQFNYVHPNYLTQMPSICSVAFCTTSTEEGQPLVEFLSYFNYLKKNACWIETIPVGHSLLGDEGQSLGLRTWSGIDMYCLYDQIWADRVLQKKIDIDRYKMSLSMTLGA